LGVADKAETQTQLILPLRGIYSVGGKYQEELISGKNLSVACPSVVTVGQELSAD
jgi:hypothetical protein